MSRKAKSGVKQSNEAFPTAFRKNCLSYFAKTWLTMCHAKLLIMERKARLTYQGRTIRVRLDLTLAHVREMFGNTHLVLLYGGALDSEDGVVIADPAYRLEVGFEYVVLDLIVGMTFDYLCSIFICRIWRRWKIKWQWFQQTWYTLL
jgi:hypothetical protein